MEYLDQPSHSKATLKSCCKGDQDLQKSIYQGLFALSDRKGNSDDSESITFQNLLVIMDYLQILSFSFHAIVLEHWNTGQSFKVISKSLGKINLAILYQNIEFPAFLSLVYLLCLIELLIFVGVALIAIKQQQKYWFQALISKMIRFLTTILFLPASGILFSAVNCTTNQRNDSLVLSGFPQVICWEGQHLCHAITALLSVVILIIISIVAILTIRANCTSNLSTKRNSRRQIIILSNKIALQLIFIFKPFQSSSVYCTILFLCSAAVYYMAYFYDDHVSKFDQILSSYYLWTNSMLFVSLISSNLGFDGGFIVWFFGLPFIAFLTIFYNDENGYNLSSQMSKIKTETHLENHIRNVLKLVDQSATNRKSYALLIVYIQAQQQNCTEKNRPLKKQANKLGQTREKIVEQVLQKVEVMLRNGCHRYPNSVQLKIFLGLFYLERLNNKNRAFEQFYLAEQLNPNLQQSFVIFKLSKIIRQTLTNNAEKTKFKDLMIFDNHIKHFQQSMLSSARLYKQFWNQLSEPIPHLKKLYQLGQLILTTDNSCKDYYQKIHQLNNRNSEVIFAYACFLITVNRNFQEGSQIMKCYKNIYGQKRTDIRTEMKRKQDDYFNTIGQELPALVVSVKKQHFCQISHQNWLFSDLTGFAKQDLIERNLHKILPSLLKDDHQRKINEFLSNTHCINSNYLNTPRFGYILTKAGHIIPITYIVIYKPAFEKMLLTFSVLHNFPRNTCHLIIDQNNVVRNSCRLAKQFFGLSNNLKQLPGYRIGIEDVAELDLNQQKWTEKALIFSGGIQRHCLFKVSTIEITQQFINQSNNEAQPILTRSCLNIGYYLQIQCPNYQRIQTRNLETQQDSKISVDFSDSQDEVMALYQIQDEVMTLYEMVPKYEDFSANPTNINSSFKRFQLTQKIKQLKLINNELRMVYKNDEFNQFTQSKVVGEDAEQENYGQARLKEQYYTKKIRQAISITIWHPQVWKLKMALIFLIIFVIAANIINNFIHQAKLDELSSEIQANYEKINMYKQVSKLITATALHQERPQEFYQHIQSFNMNYKAPQQITLKTTNGIQIKKSLHDSIRYIVSELGNYFLLLQQQSDDKNLQNESQRFLHIIYENYIQKIYPVIADALFDRMLEFIDPSLFIQDQLLELPISLVPALAFYVFWLYTRARIDKKINNIMLLFLDIPDQLLGNLCRECSNYIKQFKTLKELMQKGISEQDEQILIKDSMTIEQQSRQKQEQRARKPFLFRQRKRSLISYLEVGYYKMSLIIIFIISFWGFTFFQLLDLHETMKFIKNPLFKMGEQITKANFLIFESALHFTDYHQLQEIRQKQREDAINLFKNYITQQKINDFNYRTIGYTDNLNIVYGLTQYTSVLFTDICVFLNNTEIECQQIAGATLKGSFRTFSMFLIDSNNLSDQDTLLELKIGTQKYATEAIFRVIQIWRQMTIGEINRVKTSLNIYFYVYTFLGLTIFIILWLLYLDHINNQISNSLKMLRMIPNKVMCNFQKQTRAFFSQLIRKTTEALYT